MDELVFREEKWAIQLLCEVILKCNFVTGTDVLISLMYIRVE